MKRAMVLGLALLLTAMLAGCGEHAATHEKSTAAEPAAEPVAEAAMPATFEMTEEIGAKLAAADLVDGEEDKVVSNCPGCSLAMKGSNEHALPVGDYSLHFCSDSCMENFAKDVGESVIAMSVPAE
jgi:methionine-rich copper-binding protein CopC